MKKLVVLWIIICTALLCGCSTVKTGKKYELTENSWKARLDGGGRLSLRFGGGRAELKMENGENKTVISGEYLADDKTLVIFVPELMQNYGFGYTPRGNLLDLSFNGATVTFTADDGERPSNEHR